MDTTTDSGIAPHLLPARKFDDSCDQVVRYLARVAPMGLWAVTRIVDDRQIVLTATGDAYDITPGVELVYEASLCRWMVGGHAPRIAGDVSAVPPYAVAAAAQPVPIGAYVGTPIVAPDGSLYGTVCGYDPSAGPEPAGLDDELLDLLSGLLSAVLAADLYVTRAERDVESARRESDVDALTGLLNRRGWDRFLEREQERFRRFGDPAGVVILDLDRLKDVNDSGGHEAGDAYICAAARALTSAVRADDVVARLGGDEFGIVAVGATEAQTRELVGRAERALDAAGVAGSFGHAPYSVVAGFPGAVRAADDAMYEQKRRRRAARAPLTAAPGPAASPRTPVDQGQIVAPEGVPTTSCP